MCQLAEHLKESAVLPLKQPKKPVSVIGTTSNSDTLLVEWAFCFHNTRAGFLCWYHALQQRPLTGYGHFNSSS